MLMKISNSYFDKVNLSTSFRVMGATKRTAGNAISQLRNHAFSQRKKIPSDKPPAFNVETAETRKVMNKDKNKPYIMFENRDGIIK